MIQELTKENLQSLGFNENEVNKLYSTTENYTYQSNNGNIFVSKTENKIYTGIDFYRITYFENGNLRFPYNCPDLVNEYFDLALNEFLQKQKSILGLLYNETDQFNKFILLETKQSELIIKEQKDYIELYDKRQWHNKEKIINILESYINFLKLKQQPKAVIDNVEPNKVFQHFKTLVDNGYITQQNLNDFLFTVFEKNETLPIKIDIMKLNSKTKVKKIFYKYFETYVQSKYGMQKKYIDLLCNNITGFNSKTLSTNFAK